MVADGMSLGTLTCADYLSHHVRQRGLTWIESHRETAYSARINEHAINQFDGHRLLRRFIELGLRFRE